MLTKWGPEKVKIESVSNPVYLRGILQMNKVSDGLRGSIDSLIISTELTITIIKRYKAHEKGWKCVEVEVRGCPTTENNEELADILTRISGGPITYPDWLLGLAPDLKQPGS